MSYYPEGAYEALCKMQDAAASRDERLEAAREAWRTEILTKAAAGEKYQPLTPFGKHRPPVDPVLEMAYHMYEQAMDPTSHMHRALREFASSLTSDSFQASLDTQAAAKWSFWSAAQSALKAEIDFNAENEVDAS